MASNTLDHVAQEGHEKNSKAMATKLSENFAINILKKYKKNCRHGLTQLNATPTFKNCSETYGPPCSCLLHISKLSNQEYSMTLL